MNEWPPESYLGAIQKKKSDSFTLPDRQRLNWLAVDLDGTLAESIWPAGGIGSPIWSNVAKVHHAHAEGWTIVIHTSRGWEAHETITGWLRKYGIPFQAVVCGKLLAAGYVDDRAILPSAELWTP